MTGHSNRKAASKQKLDAKLRNRIRKLERNVQLLATSIVGMSKVI